MSDQTEQKVRMKLVPEDDFMHPLETAENFNESMYFNLFDRENQIGGWFRLANRPNEGRGEMSCCVYLPDGRIGFMFRRPERHDNDAFDGGGMTFTVEQPHQRLALRYRGKLCVLSDPQEMMDPASAFKNNPVVPAEIDLAFDGVSPMFGGEPVNEDGSPLKQDAAASFARSSPRFEQWVLQLPGVGRAVADYRSGLGMPKRAKVTAIAMMAIAISISVGLVLDNATLRISIVIAGLIGVWYIVRRVPTAPPSIPAACSAISSATVPLQQRLRCSTPR